MEGKYKIGIFLCCFFVCSSMICTKTYTYSCLLFFFRMIWSIIWTIIWLYPQVVFVAEVRSGVMSPQTYPREKHSYCCNVWRVENILCVLSSRTCDSVMIWSQRMDGEYAGWRFGWNSTASNLNKVLGGNYPTWIMWEVSYLLWFIFKFYVLVGCLKMSYRGTHQSQSEFINPFIPHWYIHNPLLLLLLEPRG